MERVKQKHKSIQESRATPYDKEGDRFWSDWKNGFDIASHWDKENHQFRNRQQQRIRERNDIVYQKTWSKFCVKPS